VNHYYFDHNATTPVSTGVLDVYLPALRDIYGNASSVHSFGQAAKQSLETARRQTAAFLNCSAKEVIFLSGGTEADNLAIFGTVRGCARERKHVITTLIEHPAVLNSCAQLEREGVAVTYLSVSRAGVVDPENVRRAIRPETALISVMHANNELGTVQPIAEITAIARAAGIVFHSDGVQAAGKVPVDVQALGVDLYALSGHKIYAPKGVGVLFVRNGVTLAQTQFGGRHERGLRPGTENVAGAVAFGAAAEWAGNHMAGEAIRLSELRSHLERGILASVPDSFVNAAGVARTPNTSNIRFGGVQGDALLIALDLKGFAVSSGAACSSGSVEPSHVLTAIGLDKSEARSSLRFSLGRSNTHEQVDALIAAVAEAVARLRHLAPAGPFRCLP
jgi:cysteine desulfurase